MYTVSCIIVHIILRQHCTRQPVDSWVESLVIVASFIVLSLWVNVRCLYERKSRVYYNITDSYQYLMFIHCALHQPRFYPYFIFLIWKLYTFLLYTYLRYTRCVCIFALALFASMAFYILYYYMPINVDLAYIIISFQCNGHTCIEWYFLRFYEEILALFKFYRYFFSFYNLFHALKLSDHNSQAFVFLSYFCYSNTRSKNRSCIILWK